MADPKTAVVMEVPEDLIKAQIQAAVVQALAGNKPEVFIGALVKTVLQAKKDSYSHSPTILQQTVDQMIREVAEEFLRAYVDELRPMIRGEVEARLKNKKKFAAQIADAIIAKFSTDVRVFVSFGAERD